ncbi:MAG: D-2-hydroxyacid dehydrogenase [Synergistaceae bacterium]|jgi:phosphoglycerate dehydrogenase-like enzyme|nr:D-2-hydroxyacid dehydrogenase [Synergistaceae bacterium]
MEKRTFHVHVEFNRSAKDVFHFTRRHLDDLMLRNPDLEDQVRFTLSDYPSSDLSQWTSSDLDAFYSNMADADILVGHRFPVKDLAKRAPRLRWIHCFSSGVDHLMPFDWVPEGVTVVNNRGVHLPKSGETFATFLRMLNAQVPRLLTAQRRGKWDRVFTSIIEGRTLVVVGVGNQGEEMARQAKNMSLRVIGIDPAAKEDTCCDEMLPPERMREAFEKADFLAITAPLTEKTRNLIDREKLDWLPRKAGVINVARGPLLDQNALHDKLCAGELSGAILDVFDPEPLPPDSKLWDTPNLVITPHVSSDDSVGYIPRTLDLTIENLRNDMAGRPLKNAVDTQNSF